MENINIKNGVPIINSNTYCMYHMYLPDTTDFFMSIPTETFKTYKMIIDFANIDFKSNGINIDDKIKNKYSFNLEVAYEEYPNCIYVLIPKKVLKEFNDAINENDDRLYELLLEKLNKYKNYAYWSIANVAVFEDSISVEPEVNIIKQSEEDKKLFWWFDIKGIKGFKQIELHENTKEIVKKRIEELKELEELKRIEELKKQEEIKKQKELEKQEKLKKQEELKKQKELKIQEEIKKQKELLKQEELRKQEELKKQKELKRLEKIKKEEELKRQEELKKLEELRRIEAAKRYKELPTPVIVFDKSSIPVPTSKQKTPTGDGVHSTGYSNMTFIILILIISSIMGICLAFLIFK